jgi:hypothetical protein
MDNNEIEALTERILREVRRAILEANSDYSIFPLADTRKVARMFGVSVWTVRDWHKQGLLDAHYHLVSGRVVKLVFTNKELCRFFDENFPSGADLRMSPFHPKSSRAQRIHKMLTLKRLYHRRRQVE